jgi:hypothetical protein
VSSHEHRGTSANLPEAVTAFRGPELATARGEHAREAAEPGRREQMRLLTQDAGVGWIIFLVEASDPNAVRLSLAEADAYLASFGDPTGTAARRTDLIAELRERACPEPRWRPK